MLVKELIAELQQFDPDLPVCIPDSNEDWLWPSLCTGCTLANGGWSDGNSPNIRDAPFKSTYVRLDWLC